MFKAYGFGGIPIYTGNDKVSRLWNLNGLKDARVRKLRACSRPTKKPSTEPNSPVLLTSQGYLIKLRVKSMRILQKEDSNKIEPTAS